MILNRHWREVLRLAQAPLVAGLFAIAWNADLGNVREAPSRADALPVTVAVLVNAPSSLFAVRRQFCVSWDTVRRYGALPDRYIGTVAGALTRPQARSGAWQRCGRTRTYWRATASLVLFERCRSI
jgi:hypothetical protein